MDKITPIMAEKILHNTQFSQMWRIFSYGGTIPVDDKFYIEITPMGKDFKSIRIMFVPTGYSSPKEMTTLQKFKQESKQNKLESNIEDGGELW